jgi:YHS domain-containing protein
MQTGVPPAIPPTTQPAIPPAIPNSPVVQNQATPSPKGDPSFGLDAFCPVTLCEKQQWVLGDRRWGLNYHGRTYLFAGPEELKRFNADPDRYAPVIAGNDVVTAAEKGQFVPGMREHGVFFGQRVYLFSSEESLEKFAKNPNVYANQALEALRSGAFPGRQLR